MQISTMMYNRGNDVVIRAYSPINPNGISRIVTRAEFLQMPSQEIWNLKQELSEQLSNIQAKGYLDGGTLNEV